MLFIFYDFRVIMMNITKKLITPNAILAVRNLSVLSFKELRCGEESCITNTKYLQRSNLPNIRNNAFRPVELKRNFCSKESLFSDSYVSEEWRQRLGNVNEMRDSIQAKFGESGIKQLVLEDLMNLIGIADNKDHLKMAADMIQHFFEEEYRVDAPNRNRIISSFVKRCCKLNELETAQDFWNQSHVEFSQKGKSTHVYYYTILYNHGKFEDIIEDYDKMTNQEQRNMEPLSLIVTAALGRMGTKEALNHMCHLVKKGSLTPGFKAKSIALCSYVAYNLKELGLAFDLCNSWRTSRKVEITNVKLAILIEAGKLKEATMFLKSLKTKDCAEKRKAFISFETMKKYTDAVKESNDEKLIKDAINLGEELDKFLIDSKLEEIVFERVHILSKEEKDKPSNEKQRVSELRNNH